WETALTLMPPTASPAHVTVGSLNSSTRRPTYCAPSVVSHAFTSIRNAVLDGFHGFPGCSAVTIQTGWTLSPGRTSVMVTTSGTAMSTAFIWSDLASMALLRSMAECELHFLV